MGKCGLGGYRHTTVKFLEPYIRDHMSEEGKRLINIRQKKNNKLS